MSVSLRVYLHEERLPSRDEWQRAIADAGISLKLDDVSTTEHSGFLPVRLDGEDCVFEFHYGPVDPEQDGDMLPSVGGRNRIVELVMHGGRELDSRAAMLAAAVLARQSDGILFDPQGGDLADGSEVFDWMDEQEAEEREHRMAAARKKWSNITERRCPSCGAPCPEYRKLCFVCRFELGRA
jgi:hypothetical protein